MIEKNKKCFPVIFGEIIFNAIKFKLPQMSTKCPSPCFQKNPVELTTTHDILFFIKVIISHSPHTTFLHVAYMSRNYFFGQKHYFKNKRLNLNAMKISLKPYLPTENWEAHYVQKPQKRNQFCGPVSGVLHIPVRLNLAQS